MPKAASTILSTPRSKRKPPRHEVPAGEHLCSYCTAKCCRYFALGIDKPTTRADFDHLRWFLLHEHVAVFVEDRAWYLLVQTPCKHLRKDHRCGIYDRRPQICRDYVTDNCEYDDDWTYEMYWDSPEQVEQYEKEYFERRYRGKKKCSRKKPPTTVKSKKRTKT
ncbi:MAG: YkgJ family cysteine cluster protein [Thermoguttaceae bacterium]